MKAGIHGALVAMLAVMSVIAVGPAARAQADEGEIPTEAQRLDLLGTELMEKGEYEEASAAFQEAVEADSTMITAWLHLALAYTEMGRKDPEFFVDAHAIYERLVRYVPADDVEMLRGRAYLHALAGDYDGAVAGYRRILEVLPDDCDAWAELSRVRALQSEATQEALGPATPELKTYATDMTDAQLRLLELCPDRVTDYADLFNMFTRSRRYEEGAETFQSLLDLHPGDAELIRRTGDLYFMSRNWGEAARLFGELLVLEVENQEYRLKYISSLRKIEKFELADAELQKYIEIRDAQAEEEGGGEGNN